MLGHLATAAREFASLGGESLQLPARRGVAQRLAAGGTSSQRKLLAIGSTSASDVQIDVNLRVMLTGGRSNLRFVTRQ